MLQRIKPKYLVSRPKITRVGSITHFLRLIAQRTWSVNTQAMNK